MHVNAAAAAAAAAAVAAAAAAAAAAAVADACERLFAAAFVRSVNGLVHMMHQ
jgi:hypothetical protein